MKKTKTKKRHKKTPTKFGQSLPYNELNMNFNKKLVNILGKNT